MQFGVLGTLTVHDADGREVAVHGPARRLLLGALLARAGQPVRVDTLLDDLWAGMPPTTGVRTLRSHMARLRQDLGEGADALVTQPSGYLLDLTGSELDAALFETLVGQGSRLFEDGRLLEARSSFDRATGLWRGAAYAEFGDAVFAMEQRLRLTEIRAHAQERRADVALALGEGAALVPELEAQVAAEPYRERPWEQLMIALYRAGRQADALATYRRMRQEFVEELGLEPRPATAELHERILRHDPSIGLRSTPEVTVVAGATSPYVGLRAFRESETWAFVGRERAVSEAVGRLSRRGLLVLTGASGVGKSSLIHAGLIPALRSGVIGGSERWRIAVVPPEGLPHLDDQDDPIPGRGADLYVVDQAEELFTLSTTEERAAANCALARVRAAGCRIILALRGDFYDRLGELSAVEDAVDSSTYLVRPMRADELRRAIVEPAGRAGVLVDDAMVEQVLDDVAGQEASLPLVAAALARAWVGHEGRMLTLADYRTAGGVAGALEATAEEMYGRLTEEARTACRLILVRLVQREPTGWVGRARRPDDLVGVDRGVEAMEALTSSRLVTADAERATLAHEALLRAWPRLSRWLDERDLVVGVVDHLADASRSWDSGGRRDEDLYRGARLHAALEAKGSGLADLTPREETFLEASRVAAEREQFADRLRAEREARARRRLTRVAAGLAVAVVLSVAAGGLAWQARRSAASSATDAVAGRLAALSGSATDTRTAALLAVAAYRTRDTAATRGALLDVLQRHDGARWHVDLPTAPTALVAAGSRLWVSDDSRTLRAVDVSSGRVTGTADPPVSRVESATPTGALLGVGRGQALVAHDPSPVTVLDGRNLAVTRVLPVRALGVSATAHGVALTPDGRWLTVVRAGRGLYPDHEIDRAALFDLSSPGAAPREIHVPDAAVAALSARHEVVLVTVSGTLETVDLPSGRVVARARPAALRSGADQMALSPDGHRLVLTSRDQPTRPFVLDPRRPERAAVFLGSSARPVVAIAFSASGRKLALATASGTTLVYDARTDLPVDTLTGNAAPVQAIAWSPTSDDRLYTADQLDQVTAWDLGGEGRLVAASGPDRPNIGPVLQFGDLVAGETPWAYGPQDELFTLDLRTGQERTWPLGLGRLEGVNLVDLDASRSRALVSEEEQDGHNHFVVRDLSSGAVVDRFDPPPGAEDTIPLMAALAPDGRTAYLGVDHRHVDVVALGSHRVLRTLTPRFPEGGRLQVVPWAFDPRGRLLVWCYDPGPSPGTADTSPTDFRVGLVDPRTGRLLAQHGLGVANPESFAWSRDGRLLAVGSTTGQVVLLDASTMRPVTAPVTAGADGIATVSFSPDATMLVTGGGDSEARLWSVPGLEPVGGALTPEDPRSDTSWFAWFTSTGLLTGLVPAGSGTLRWGSVDASPATWARAACALAGTDLTASEWRRAVGDRPFRPVCPH